MLLVKIKWGSVLVSRHADPGSTNKYNYLICTDGSVQNSRRYRIIFWELVTGVFLTTRRLQRLHRNTADHTFLRNSGHSLGIIHRLYLYMDQAKWQTITLALQDKVQCHLYLFERHRKQNYLTSLIIWFSHFSTFLSMHMENR